MKRFTVLLALVTGSLMFWMGCEKSTDPVTKGSLTFSSRYSSAQAPAPSWTTLAKSAGVAAADSIVISKARFVLKDIKFKTNTDSMSFKRGPMILDVNLGSGMQTINVADVPLADYNRIEFDVHRTESTEVALFPSTEQAAFADFLAGERYSIIIEGTVYRTPQSDTTFVFRSKIDAQQKYEFVPPLPIQETTPTANVTMLLSSGSWFMGPSGLLDPSDIANQSLIDENLKTSIRVFKDNNKDGSKD